VADSILAEYGAASTVLHPICKTAIYLTDTMMDNKCHEPT
jgi:hypothetical protein